MWNVAAGQVPAEDFSQRATVLAAAPTSVFASAPYLHSGAAPTLDAVLENKTHRTAGRADGFDLLSISFLRSLVVDFLSSIDRSTETFPDPVPPSNICGPVTP